jgi:hypothetical protein
MIENKIEETNEVLRSLIAALTTNTAAKEANTAALNAVLAASGTTPATAQEPAPKKAPAPAKEKAKPKIEVAPEPEPAAEEEAAPFETDKTRDEYLQEISTTVKGWLAKLGNNVKAGMASYTALREKWSIKAATDLTDEQLGPFLADVREMMEQPLG